MSECAIHHPPSSSTRSHESGPLRVVHLSRHKWPGGLVEGICSPLTPHSPPLLHAINALCGAAPHLFAYACRTTRVHPGEHNKPFSRIKGRNSLVTLRRSHLRWLRVPFVVQTPKSPFCSVRLCRLVWQRAFLNNPQVGNT